MHRAAVGVRDVDRRGALLQRQEARPTTLSPGRLRAQAGALAASSSSSAAPVLTVAGGFLAVVLASLALAALPLPAGLALLLATAPAACSAPAALLRGGPWVLASGLIADGDEERGDVFAMLLGLRKDGAVALALDALGGEHDLHRVRIGIGAADLALGRSLEDLDVLDDAAPGVLEASEESASAKEAAKAAVAQRGECVGNR